MVLQPVLDKRPVAKSPRELVGFFTAYDVRIDAKSRVHQVEPVGTSRGSTSVENLVGVSNLLFRWHLYT